MIEHPQSGADERLHLERFLRTSATYFGLASPQHPGPRQVSVCHNRTGPVDRPVPQSGPKRAQTRR